MCMSVCNKTRLWALLVTMVMGLDPGVSLLTQLWELTQTCLFSGYFNRSSCFLSPGNSPFLCPTNPRQEGSSPALKLASKLRGTGANWPLQESHRAGQRGRWETCLVQRARN